MSFWAVDAHVHLPRRPTPISHFDPFAGDGGDASPAAGVLLLADTADQNGIETLARAGEGPMARAWTRKDDCGTPYLLSMEAPYPLIVIAGFQLVTSESLEVLALMMPERPADGRPLHETLETVIEAGGLPVLPWGVGKWLGRRGRLVSEIIDRACWRGRVALADNANRPALWPTPKLLRRGRAAGFAVLHGSDPLPLRGESGRIGSAGVTVAAGPLDAPVGYLRRVLREPERVGAFGRAMPASGFVYRQVALRLGMASA